MTHDHVVSPKVYVLIFLALMVGTAATVGAALLDLGDLTIVVALLIAIIKATLVVLFFMHLRYSHRLNWVFGAAAIFWLVLLVGLTMADVIARAAEQQPFR